MEPQPSARTSRKRTEILDAAAAAFRDEGYDTTSMDRIAELAKASKRTVYNHFGSKDALFKAVVQRFHEQIITLKNIPWDETRTLEAQLNDFARSKIDVANDPTWLGLLRVVFGVFISNPELARDALQRSAHGEDTLVEWLKHAHAAQQLHVPDPERAALQFWALITGALFWPQIFAFKEPMDHATQRELTLDLIETFLSRYRP